MKKRMIGLVISAAMMVGCGAEDSSSNLNAKPDGNRVEVIEPAVMGEPTVVLTQNDLGQTGYMIKVEFQVGSNACRASGVHYELRQRVVEDQIEVTAYRVAQGAISGMQCPADYSPVFTTADLFVKVQLEDPKSVVLHHVGNRDRIVSADALVK